MPEQMIPWVNIIGRVLFSAIFIMSGLNHFMKTKDVAGYARSRGVPAAEIWVRVTGAMILVGGLSVALGWHRFVGAGLLAIFLVLSAFFVHHFWTDKDPGMRQGEMVHFLKDVSMAGAALFIALHAGEIWPISVGG